MAWGSQIDTLGDRVECGDSRIQSSECVSHKLPLVHKGLDGSLEPFR